MDDTATKQVAFTKEENLFLFRCILAENNRLNNLSLSAEDKVSMEQWNDFLALANSSLAKIRKLTELPNSAYL